MTPPHDPLEVYRDKRDFERTPEPSTGKPTEGNPRFVVQQHAARAMHWDVRFEVDGVMPSWAVPKGPSYDPKVRRLAVHTEDHPLDYRHFEGVIPAGEHGGGRVIVWDEGTYANVTQRNGEAVSMRAAIDAGHFSVQVTGEKLQGGWSFSRTRRDRSGKEQWIMIKRADESADPQRDVVKDEPRSVRSGLTVVEVTDEQTPDLPTVASTSSDRANWLVPMLAQLTGEPPVGDEWTYERKLDGLRCLAVRNGDEVRLWSRNQLSFDARFPALRQALRELPADNFVLDGEIVAYDETGNTSFGRLQNGDGAEAVLVVFDVLHLLGQDVRGLSLAQRRRLLGQVVVDEVQVQIQVSQPLAGSNEGAELLVHACAEGWEGIMAKRLDGPYRAGRSSDWRKLKCLSSQELVIGGWTDPKGARTGFGALLVGYYDDVGLRYAGKVGTGFNARLLLEIHNELIHLARPASPFADQFPSRDVHWVEPALVAQIDFGEWTSEGRLRHPRFVGLRVDKVAADVRREIVGNGG